MKIELTGLAKEKYDELINIYILDEKTEAAIISICKNHSRFIESEKALDEKGMLYKNPSGKIEKSPLLDISNTMQKQIKDNIKYLEQYKINFIEVSEPGEYSETKFVDDSLKDFFNE